MPPFNNEFIVPDYCVLHGVADICTVGRAVGTWTNLRRLTFDFTEFLHGREWCQSEVNRAYSCCCAFLRLDVFGLPTRNVRG
jgi:hypothetical protein